MIISDIFALLLAYADIVGTINLADGIPSATLAAEYAERTPEEWNKWLDRAILTGVHKVDLLLACFAKNTPKRYDDLSVKMIVLMSSESWNRV